MHIIHDIAFEVAVNYDNSLVSWEQYYVDFFQERLLPRVERICDDWDRKHPNSKCVIDTIDINVDVENIDLEVLQKKIIQQISQQLLHIQSDGKNSEGTVVATITKEASSMDGLLEYLENGLLPERISVKNFKEWLGSVSEFTSVEENTLRTLFATKIDAIARMLSLLRNDYEKLSNIITKQQQITEQFVKLEATFFQQLLKEICTQLKLEYKTEEADIWFKTLGFSSSLPQFTKTFFQLLTPKAAAENKRFTKVDELQFSMLVMQAVAQNEVNHQLQLEVSKVMTIVNDYTSESQNETQTASDIKAAFQKEKEAQQKEQLAAKEEKQKAKTIEASEEKKSKTSSKEASKTTETNVSKASKETKGATLSKETQKATNETASAKEQVSNSAEAKAQPNKNTSNSEVYISRKPIAKEIALTTEKAGLILLHPFLSRFFQGIGLVDDNHEIKDISKACMLLHYLATETEDVTDVELALEKILLGIPQETVINYQTPLTEKDKEICVELLEAVLEHWVVLKKSTVNTLRDMFLKRDGQISITEKSLKLKIERAAQDVLLDKVPWNISLFRLKCMEKRMHIEW
jgi:chemotaxis protein histidine kinase CheA